MKTLAYLAWFAGAAALALAEQRKTDNAATSGRSATDHAAGAETIRNAKAPLDGAFETKVLQTMRAWGAPGLVVVVVRNGQTLHSKGYGTRVPGADRSINPQTRFHIASHSKAVTATALAMLVDGGKLSWDDRVVKYIPELVLSDPLANANVTVRDLVLHRSGLTGKPLGGFNNAAFAMRELLVALRTEPPAAGFREQQVYSQAGIALAGELVARVSGTPWEKFVHERIFGPLGMTSSYTSNPDLHQRFGAPSAEINIFLGAEKRNGAIVRDDWRGVGTAAVYAPAGGITTTADDLAKWMLCLLHDGEYAGGRLLSAKSLHELWSPAIVVDPALANLLKPVASIAVGGLGWIIVPYAGRRILEAPGAWMSSVVALMPEERLGVAVATNANFSERAPYESIYLVNAIAMIALDTVLGLPDRDWNTEFDAAVVAQSARRKAAPN